MISRGGNPVMISSLSDWQRATFTESRVAPASRAGFRGRAKACGTGAVHSVPQDIGNGVERGHEEDRDREPELRAAAEADVGIRNPKHHRDCAQATTVGSRLSDSALTPPEF